MTTNEVDLEALRGFTDGPWLIDWNVSRLDIYGGDERTLIATLRRSALSEGIDAAARANARLIAAAPSMHAELTARRARDAEVEAQGDVLRSLNSAIKHLNRAIEITECNDPTNTDHAIWARDYVMNAIAALRQQPNGNEGERG